MRKDVCIVMGSQSDLEKMKEASEVLTQFKVSHELNIISAHRTPENMSSFSKKLDVRGFKLVIAGAGGAAHLPGMIASLSVLPVIGVPININNGLKGLDSILSIVQMPKGIPVATVASDNSHNAGLLAVQILSLSSKRLKNEIKKYRKKAKLKTYKSNRDLKKFF